jgi:hypothetical protein
MASYPGISELNFKIRSEPGEPDTQEDVQLERHSNLTTLWLYYEPCQEDFTVCVTPEGDSLYLLKPEIATCIWMTFDVAVRIIITACNPYIGKEEKTYSISAEALLQVGLPYPFNFGPEELLENPLKIGGPRDLVKQRIHIVQTRAATLFAWIAKCRQVIRHLPPSEKILWCFPGDTSIPTSFIDEKKWDCYLKNLERTTGTSLTAFTSLSSLKFNNYIPPIRTPNHEVDREDIRWERSNRIGLDRYGHPEIPPSQEFYVKLEEKAAPRIVSYRHNTPIPSPPPPSLAAQSFDPSPMLYYPRVASPILFSNEATFCMDETNDLASDEIIEDSSPSSPKRQTAIRSKPFSKAEIRLAHALKIGKKPMKN